MQNRDIGMGSTPIGNEAFASQARPRGSKTELVLQ